MGDGLVSFLTVGVTHVDQTRKLNRLSRNHNESLFLFSVYTSHSMVSSWLAHGKLGLGTNIVIYGMSKSGLIGLFVGLVDPLM